jgi:hypothetical protein
MKDLIIVPGHASFLAEVQLPLPADIEDDAYWALRDFQKGEPRYYIEHIKKGLELADDDSLLVFSGGRTRLESGQLWSEARTYAEIANTFPNQPPHVALEEYSRDSLQNLEFSSRKFASLYGHQPLNIYIVGWAFKEERFKRHAEALNIANTHYIGVNNPPDEKMTDALAGEQRILDDFLETPLGDSGTLQDRRSQRDPFNDGTPKDY